MISEARADLNFIIFRRAAAVASQGLSWGLKESRFSIKICRRSWASAQPAQSSGLTVRLQPLGSEGNLAKEKLYDGHILKTILNSSVVKGHLALY